MVDGVVGEAADDEGGVAALPGGDEVADEPVVGGCGAGVVSAHRGLLS